MRIVRTSIRCSILLFGLFAQHPGTYPWCFLDRLFFTLHFYPSRSKTKLHFTPAPWTSHNGVKEDNFTLANTPILNIPFFDIQFQQHFTNNLNKNLIKLERVRGWAAHGSDGGPAQGSCCYSRPRGEGDCCSTRACSRPRDPVPWCNTSSLVLED